MNNDIADRLKAIKKDIVLDDNMNTDRQSALLSNILYVIRLAEMTDAEYVAQYSLY